jgi:NAD(P)-dependent dehydrogenase (short-subunit alcohol dehydrogenase family)
MKPMQMTKRLRTKVALVTGASRGIGYATATALAQQGAHVIALARTVGGLEDLDDTIKAAGGSATLVPADITDFDAIDRLGASIFERWGQLDILVGNAGVLGKLSPLGHIDQKTWDNVMAVNVTANWRLIRSLDPLLRASNAGRAVFLTSGAATGCKAYWGVYSTSKAALEALVKTYAAESATSNLKVNLINPGPVRTAMRAKAMPGEDPKILPTPAELASALIATTLDSFDETGRVLDFKDGVLKTRK